MSGDLNKVRLVLPVGQGEPLVMVDGVEIKGVVAAQIDHDPRAGTVLHLAFVANVDCKTAMVPEDVPDASDAPTEDEAGEWVDMGVLGGMMFQRHSKTGEQRKVRRK